MKIKLYRADRLKGVMAAKSVTTAALSKKTGLGHTTIIALRKGADAKVSTLAKVAKALGAPLIYFFEEDAI